MSRTLRCLNFKLYQMYFYFIWNVLPYLWHFLAHCIRVRTHKSSCCRAIAYNGSCVKRSKRSGYITRPTGILTLWLMPRLHCVPPTYICSVTVIKLLHCECDSSKKSRTVLCCDVNLRTRRSDLADSVYWSVVNKSLRNLRISIDTMKLRPCTRCRLLVGKKLNLTFKYYVDVCMYMRKLAWFIIGLFAYYLKDETKNRGLGRSSFFFVQGL